MKRGLRILLIVLATMTVLVGAGVGAIYAGWIGNPLSYQTQLEITGRLACGNRFVDAKLDEAYEKYVTFNCNLTEAEPSAKAIEQILADLTRLTPLVMKGHGREKGYEILAINFGRGRDVYGNPSREVAVRVFMGAEIYEKINWQHITPKELAMVLRKKPFGASMYGDIDWMMAWDNYIYR